MNKIDLHMHTVVSDGTDSLEEIIKKVQDAGIDLFSITDHDAIKAGMLVPPIRIKASASYAGSSFRAGMKKASTTFSGTDTTRTSRAYRR